MKKSENIVESTYNKWMATINQNFLIRYKYTDDRKTSLIGAGRFWVLFDSKEKANEIFTKVWGAGEAKKTFKFRRGLVIDFVSK